MQREKLAKLFGHMSPAWIVLAVGIIVSGAAWKATESQAERDARAKFESAVSDTRDAIEIGRAHV